MANDWFKFKQFTINQSGSAMKVGTDGVLLGAWASIPETGSKVLDVGTGTGLLSLMIAQRYLNAKVLAIEIDKSSCNQAIENFINSNWSKRIGLSEIAFQDLNVSLEDKYDLIISNPPYFKDSFKTQNAARTRARHQGELTLKELLSGVKKLLNNQGRLSLILPFDQKIMAISLAMENGLFPFRILNVRPNPEKEFIRTLLEFSFTEGKISETELIIEMDRRHVYSEEYKALTKDFYLKF